MKSEFNRIERLPPYIFSEINKLKAKLRKEGNDIIDFGMGNPDMPTPKHIKDKLKEVIDILHNKKAPSAIAWPEHAATTGRGNEKTLVNIVNPDLTISTACSGPDIITFRSNPAENIPGLP